MTWVLAGLGVLATTATVAAVAAFIRDLMRDTFNDWEHQ